MSSCWKNNIFPFYREGHTTLVSNVLQTAKILIIHLGPSLLPLPMGLIPLSQNSLRYNFTRIKLVKSWKLFSSPDSWLQGAGFIPIRTHKLIRWWRRENLYKKNI